VGSKQWANWPRPTRTQKGKKVISSKIAGDMNRDRGGGGGRANRSSAKRKEKGRVRPPHASKQGKKGNRIRLSCQQSPSEDGGARRPGKARGRSKKATVRVQKVKNPVRVQKSRSPGSVPEERGGKDEGDTRSSEDIVPQRLYTISAPQKPC